MDLGSFKRPTALNTLTPKTLTGENTDLVFLTKELSIVNQATWLYQRLVLRNP